jgi:hypothetical protein
MTKNIHSRYSLFVFLFASSFLVRLIKRKIWLMFSLTKITIIPINGEYSMLNDIQCNAFDSLSASPFSIKKMYSIVH